ncbi:hypothetical protein Sjap_007454 [Stephania japonica]|uniref:Uncharacterized protein n=1 Tax=Stephania japonica TaxID=461633 RepID=A0AAP0JPV6_9MAGN
MDRLESLPRQRPCRALPSHDFLPLILSSTDSQTQRELKTPRQTPLSLSLSLSLSYYSCLVIFCTLVCYH